MSLPHARSGDVIDIRPLGERLENAVSTALFKTRALEVMRLILPKDKWMPEHKVTGEITIQCLEGVIELHAHQKVQVLRANEMVYLAGNELHALKAIEDASVLLTILLDQQETSETNPVKRFNH